MTSAHVQPGTQQRLRPLLAMMVVALVAEFILGTANNLWLNLPDSGSGWGNATPAWLIMIHIVLGVLIVVLAVWVGVLAVRARVRPVTAAVHTGALGIVISFGAGIGFLSETSSDVSSFVMAVGCGISIVAYALALYFSPLAEA